MNATQDQINEPGRTGTGYGGSGYGNDGEMSRLFSDVEDLLKRVTHMNDVDVARLRERVESSLSTARDSFNRSATRVRASAGEVVDSTDEYVHRKPWTVAGIAMIAGALIGAALLSNRR